MIRKHLYLNSFTKPKDYKRLFMKMQRLFQLIFAYNEKIWCSISSSKSFVLIIIAENSYLKYVLQILSYNFMN